MRAPFPAPVLITPRLQPCILLGADMAGRLRGDICPSHNLAQWLSLYILQSAAPQELRIFCTFYSEA